MKTGYNKYWSAVILFMGLAFIASPANAVGTLIVAAIMQTTTFTFAMTLAATAINIAVSMIVAKNAAAGLEDAMSGASQNPGNRQSASPATNNKLPVVYGSAWVGGTVIDMSISTDNQWMYYVIALSEVTANGSDTFTFGDIYMGGRKCVFDATDTYKVTGLQDPSTLVTDNAVNGNLYIYTYRNGTNSNVNSPYSAYQIMTGGGSFTVDTVYKWTVQQMNKCAFAIVQMKYSQQANTTGFQQMKFQLHNPRNAPGDCFLDYFTNIVYGAGLTIDQVDTDSLTTLTNYCAEPFTYTTSTGSLSTQNRFQFNGVIDTSRSIMDNLQEMATSCDCLIKYNEITGKWGVITQKPTYSVLMNITDKKMIGALSISPLDIANSYNIIEAKFPDVTNQDSFNVATFDISQTAPWLLYPNEPINKQSVTLSLVNNNVTAQYIANRLLESGREDLSITCKIDYTGLQLEAGDIVTVTNANYGWGITVVNATDTVAGLPYLIKTIGSSNFTDIGATSNTVDTIFVATGIGTGSGTAYLLKAFRVNKVTENFGNDGTITADLVLSEFNAQTFDDKDITQFVESPNTGLPNALTFGTLDPPYIIGQTPTAAEPFFYVVVPVPASGIAQYAEIYYSASSTASNPTFVGTTEIRPNGNPYESGTEMPAVVVTGIASGDWYFFYKIVNGLGTSAFSSPSSIIHWRPNSYKYPYRYLALAYADDSSGIANFSFSPRNKHYYGIRNVDTQTGSNDPADYQWFAATPTFNVGSYYVYSGELNASTPDILTIYDTTHLAIGNLVSGDNIQPDTHIRSITGNNIELTLPHTWVGSSTRYNQFGFSSEGSLNYYLLYVNWGNRAVSFGVGAANYYSGDNLKGNFVSFDPQKSGVIWSGVLDPDYNNSSHQYNQSFIDLDSATGQAILTGSTTSNANTGMVSIQPTVDGRLQVALNKFISFGVDSTGAEILHKTVVPALLTVDIFGRVVGFQEADKFYMTVDQFVVPSSGSRTVFNPVRDASYKINNCLVFCNGILCDASEYTDSSGNTNTVTFSSNRTIGDVLTIMSFRSYHLADAINLIPGNTYTIVSVGTTNFTLLGASSNTVGTTFVANSTAGSGSGTASTIYDSFSRFTQTVTNQSAVSPTSPINSGYELLFCNGVVMQDDDYNISLTGNIIDFPSPGSINGVLTVIQWAANNLTTPVGNVSNQTAYTIINQTAYNLALTPYGFNLYENGVLLVNGSPKESTSFTPKDYTALSGGYNLEVAPTSQRNVLLQQSFNRIGAA